MDQGRRGGILIENVHYLAVLDDGLEEPGDVVYLSEFLHDGVTGWRRDGVRRCEVRDWLTQLGLSLFTRRSSYNLQYSSLHPGSTDLTTSLLLSPYNEWKRTAAQFVVNWSENTLERHLNAIFISYLVSEMHLKSQQELSNRILDYNKEKLFTLTWSGGNEKRIISWPDHSIWATLQHLHLWAGGCHHPSDGSKLFIITPALIIEVGWQLEGEIIMSYTSNM